MSHDVVISYTRRNRDVAEALADQLRKRGVAVWYDGMLKEGADWRDEIANAIADTRVFVILFCATSNESQDVRKELAVATSHERRIIPLRVDDVKPRGIFDYELGRLQWTDIFPDWRKALPHAVDRILEALDGVREQEAQTELKQDGVARDEPAIAGTAKPKSEPPRAPRPDSPKASAQDATSEGQAPSVLPAHDGWMSSPLNPRLAWILMIIVAVIALVGLVPELRAVQILAAGPLWLILQIWLVRDASAGRPAAKAVQIVAYVFAAAGVLSVAGIFARFPSVVPSITFIAGFILLLVIVGAAGRGAKWLAFWILPLASSLLTIAGFRLDSAGTVLGCAGILLGCAVYGFGMSRNRARLEAALAQSR